MSTNKDGKKKVQPQSAIMTEDLIKSTTKEDKETTPIIVENPKPTKVEPTTAPISIEAPYSTEQYVADLNVADTKQAEGITSYIEKLSSLRQGAEEEKKTLLGEQAKAEKRAKSSQIVNSIGDGLASLSNLFFTARGAPSAQLSSSVEKYRAIYNTANEKRKALQNENKLRLDRLDNDYSNARIMQAREGSTSMRTIADIKMQGKQHGDAMIQKRQELADNLRLKERGLDLDEKRMENDAEYRKEQNKLKAEQQKSKEFTQKWGREIPFNIGNEVINIGELALNNQLGTLSEEIYKDAITTHTNTVAAIKQRRKNREITRKEMNNEIDKLEEDFSAMETHYLGLAGDIKKQVSFSARFLANSPKGIEKVRSIANDYKVAKGETPASTTIPTEDEEKRSCKFLQYDKSTTWKLLCYNNNKQISKTMGRNSRGRSASYSIARQDIIQM